jgi:hypothetical protein
MSEIDPGQAGVRSISTAVRSRSPTQGPQEGGRRRLHHPQRSSRACDRRPVHGAQPRQDPGHGSPRRGRARGVAEPDGRRAGARRTRELFERQGVRRSASAGCSASRRLALSHAAARPLLLDVGKSLPPCEDPGCRAKPDGWGVESRNASSKARSRGRASQAVGARSRLCENALICYDESAEGGAE